jgi:hypothetical protein
MHKRLVGLFLSVVAAVLLQACEKTITIAQPPYSGKVSIQSMLEADSIPIVYFNSTVPYFDPKVSFSQLVIRGAKVSVSDGTTIDDLHLDSVYDRINCEYNYFYKGTVAVQANKTYTLRITSGNDHYEATASTVNLKAAVIDSVAYTATYKDLYGEHEGVIIYFRDVPLQPNYYRYEMDRFIDTTTKKSEVKIVSACLGRDSVAVQELGRSVYSDAGQDGQPLKIVIEPAYSHRTGTNGVIRIQTIDKNAFDFFDQLDKQKLSQTNPFVEPVFLREGQFGTRAVGYFSAMQKSAPISFSYPE